MSVVVPTILTSSRQDLIEKLGRVEGLVDTVQIDAVDGRFASPATWPYTPPKDDAPELAEPNGLLALGRFRYEADLMVADPEESIGTWIAAGATRIVVHVESTDYLPRLIDDLAHRFGHDKGFAPDLLALGLSIGIETDTALLEQYLESADFVQFMGIKTIGRQGEPFDRRVLEKIKAFRAKHPSVPIQVDGGVSLATAPDLLSLGVNRLIVGSDLWKAENVEEELQRFQELVERYGTYS